MNAQAHVNGMESFWAMLKRGYHGTAAIAARMIGRRLTYAELTA